MAAGGCRSCCSSPSLCVVPTAFIGFSAAGRSGVVLFVVANFAYQSALIYYDATLKTVSRPETRGRLSGIGVGDRLLRHDLRRAAAPARSSASPVEERFLRRGRPVRAASRSRSSWSSREPGRSRASPCGRRAAARSGQLRTSIAPRPRGPGSAAVPRRAVLLLGCGEHDHRRDERRHGAGQGPDRPAGAARPAGPDGRGDLRELRLGPAASTGWGRADADDRPGVVGGRARRSAPSRSSVDGPIGIGMFLVAGAILGSGLGGVQVADRVLMVRLSPPERVGEFFGLYGLVGKGSQVIGQLLYGLTLLLFFDTLGRGRLPDRRPDACSATMLLGAWLLRPVSDRWTGSGEIDVRGAAGAAGADDGAARAALAGQGPAARRAPSPSVAGAPRPRRADHLLERRARGLPAEDLARAVDRRHERRRVAAAARRRSRAGSARPSTRSAACEDLADAEPAAAAEVAAPRAGRRAGRRPSVASSAEPVGLGEVHDVDVVADGRAVRRRVVVAEERERVAARGRRRGRSGSGGSPGRGARRCARWRPPR